MPSNRTAASLAALIMRLAAGPETPSPRLNPVGDAAEVVGHRPGSLDVQHPPQALRAAGPNGTVGYQKCLNGWRLRAGGVRCARGCATVWPSCQPWLGAVLLSA